MATLEKIRSKSVLLLVIIGAALIAFIIGDFFTSGRTFFGTGTTVAKVDGQKIEVQDFQRRLEQANQQAQQSGQKIDQALLQQQVLNGMVAEKLYQNELKALGLTVTDAELTDAMLGSGSPYLNAMIQQQFGVQSAAALHDMAFNPVKYGLDEQQALQLRGYWVSLENQMEQMLLQQKFQNLFAGTLTANQLDAKALYDENAATANIAYVKKEFSTLSDDEYPVSDDDVRKEWNNHREQYAISEPQRTVNYIAVEIVPSADDIVAATQRVEEAIAQLRSQPDLDGIAGMTEFVAERRKYNAASIRDAQLNNFADTASAGQAALVSTIGNDYTIAKLLGRAAETDSVTLDFFYVTESATAADSIIRNLNSGAIDFAQVGNVDGVEGVQTGMTISLIDPSMTQLKDALATAPTGRFFTTDTAMTQGQRVFRITNRKAPATVYDLAVINFTAEPSNATVNKLQSDLQSYINTNNKAADFAANAPEAGYQVFPATVSASTGQLSRLPDSRAAVTWAMNAKKGAVSPIIGDETTGRFIALALNDIYEDYVPATDPQVKAMLTSQVRNDKKAAALIEKFGGKASDLAGYAQLMDSRVDTVSVNFGQLSFYNGGVAGADVVAQASVAEPGKIQGPVKANTGIVVFDVVNVDTEGRPYNFEENALLYNRTRGAAALGNNLQLILLGNGTVENNLLKFFRD